MTACGGDAQAHVPDPEIQTSSEGRPHPPQDLTLQFSGRSPEVGDSPDCGHCGRGHRLEASREASRMVGTRQKLVLVV